MYNDKEYEKLDTELTNLYNNHYYKILDLIEKRNQIDLGNELRCWKMDCVQFVSSLRNSQTRIKKKKNELQIWKEYTTGFKQHFQEIIGKITDEYIEIVEDSEEEDIYK